MNFFAGEYKEELGFWLSYLFCACSVFTAFIAFCVSDNNKKFKEEYYSKNGYLKCAIYENAKELSDSAVAYFEECKAVLELKKVKYVFTSSEAGLLKQANANFTFMIDKK